MFTLLDDSVVFLPKLLVSAWLWLIASFLFSLECNMIQLFVHFACFILIAITSEKHLLLALLPHIALWQADFCWHTLRKSIFKQQHQVQNVSSMSLLHDKSAELTKVKLLERIFTWNEIMDFTGLHSNTQSHMNGQLNSAD